MFAKQGLTVISLKGWYFWI